MLSNRSSPDHLAWEQVAALYEDKSKENEVGDISDVCHYWKHKLCTTFKKPTSNSGLAQGFTLKCQRVQRMTNNSMEAKLMSTTSLNGDDDNSSFDDEVRPNSQEVDT